MIENLSLSSRLAGGVWGHLVGDAIGVPYEFRQPADIGAVRFGATGAHHQPPGTWSDDGALMLATLDSLLSAGFDPADQGRRFLDWFDRGAYTPDADGKFDVGGTTQAALARLRDGTPAVVAGGRDERDNGNGSLMRILPVALVCRELPRAELIEYAEMSSRITHQHRWSQTTCALYAVIVVALLRGDDPTAALDESVRLLREDWAAWPRPDAVEALDRLMDHKGREGRGFVFDSFWSAWDAFAGSGSYEETITRAISYGHDTDTTACIAGGLAGVHWGLEGIPREWLDGMRGRDIVEPLVRRLIAGR